MPLLIYSMKKGVTKLLNMKLTDRLQTIADFVEKGSRVADIGTDHGYLSVYLVENNIADMVIATDVNEKPLEKASECIKEYDLSKKVKTRLGNGLEPINKGEVDTVIIAGMGGHLISDILDSSKKVANSIKTFILQPMTGEEELREYLYNSDYTIVSEKLAKEGKRFYHILKVSHGKSVLTDKIFLEIGEKLLEDKDPLLGDLLELKLDKIGTIMDKLVMQETENSKKTYSDFNVKCRRLKGLLKDYES